VMPLLVWAPSIDLLFIDGDHSYEGVKADWERFLPISKNVMEWWFSTTPSGTSDRIRDGSALIWGSLDRLRSFVLPVYPAITIDKDFGVTLIQPVIGGARLR